MKTEELAKILSDYPGADVVFESIGRGFGDNYSIKDINGYRLEEANYNHNYDKEKQGILVRCVILSPFKIKPNL